MTSTAGCVRASRAARHAPPADLSLRLGAAACLCGGKLWRRCVAVLELLLHCRVGAARDARPCRGSRPRDFGRHRKPATGRVRATARTADARLHADGRARALARRDPVRSRWRRRTASDTEREVLWIIGRSPRWRRWRAPRRASTSGRCSSRPASTSPVSSTKASCSASSAFHSRCPAISRSRIARRRCADELQQALGELRSAIQRPLGRASAQTKTTLREEVERLRHEHPDLGIAVEGADPADSRSPPSSSRSLSPSSPRRSAMRTSMPTPRASPCTRCSATGHSCSR